MRTLGWNILIICLGKGHGVIQAVADQLKLKIIIAETHHICNEKY